MNKVIKIIIIATLISSCSPEVGSNAWFRTASDLEKKSYLQFSCEGYGFKKGTNAMLECIQRESNAQKERAATIGTSSGSRFGITLRGRI
ncbi:MAG: hypothetical protein CML56_01105 [Rhodobacteraceae bacterium]|nr:hypothetical protein [Paracoccaceae bacterium]